MRTQRWFSCGLAIAMLCLASSANAVDYVGINTGAIPDNDPAGRAVTFSVAGFTQPLGDVRLSMTLSHTYAGDLSATLISPLGVARSIVFARPGISRTSTFGVSADFSGNYRFGDAGANLWDVAVPLATGAIIPAADYRSTTGGTPSLQGGCTTSLSTIFGSLPAANVNGTWTLLLTDGFSGDTGSIASATLSLLPQANIISRSGFEVSPRGRCQPARFDYNGDGRSDFVLVRNTGGGTGGAITWFVKDNDVAGVGTVSSFEHGIASDFFLSGDWDGDGLADAAVFRPGTPGQFIIRRSSRPSVLLTVPFGVSGDDVSISDDFNGDGLTDFVAYRAGAAAGNPSTTLVQFNGETTVRSLTTGENGAFPLSGDFNGDGAVDVGVQSNAGGNIGRFRLFDGRSGASLFDFQHGTPTDVILDGNHSGNAIRDITVIRGVGGNIQWNTRDGNTGIVQPLITLGVSSTDFGLVGDYDGDGLDDHATWRPSATAGQSKFTIRRSTNTATPIEVFHGANGDYPVANSRSH